MLEDRSAPGELFPAKYWPHDWVRRLLESRGMAMVWLCSSVRWDDPMRKNENMVDHPVLLTEEV